MRRSNAATLCRSVLLHAFDKRSLQPPTQAQSLQCALERRTRSAAHDMRHSHQLPPSIGLFHLAVQQPCGDLPLACPAPHTCDPVPKMGSEGVAEFIELQMRQVQVLLTRSWSVVLCAPARVSQLVMVACRWPNTRTAADTSRPSASAVNTSPTRWDAVLRP